MKTLLNTKNTKIEQFNDFNELKQFSYDLFIENMTTCFSNDILKYTYDEFIDFIDYANANKNMLSHIARNAINNIYLIATNDMLFVAFMNDCDTFECYDFYEHEFDYVENIYKIEYHNEFEMLQYIIDELNKQILIKNVSRETHNN